MKKTTTTSALVVAALVMTANCAGLQGCVEFYEKRCQRCFRRYLQKDGFCGPLLPASDPCDIYTNSGRGKNRNFCVKCKPGFALGNNFSCIKGTIASCVDEELREGSPRNCFGCGPGKYSVIDPQTKTTSCKAVSSPVGNCLWGGRVNQGAIRGVTCYRCQPGFAVGVDSGLCFPAVQKGCWTQSKGRCFSCDPFEGYSINNLGNCFKTA